MNTRDWLDVADDLEEESVKDKIKSKIQHREKTHNKKRSFTFTRKIANSSKKRFSAKKIKS